MLNNEIVIEGASFSFKCVTLNNDNLEDICQRIQTKGDIFNPDTETPGFHDFCLDSGVIKGYYSVIVPFEVTHFVEGNLTKSLFKRMDSCEFMITPKLIYIWGKPSAARFFCEALSAVTGQHVENCEFDFETMSRLQGRMTVIKAIVVENPKDKPIRRARLTGHMEDYDSYNIVDPRNHEIDNISGLVETPLGWMKLTVAKKGKITLGVKKGLAISSDNLNWIMDLVTNEQMPQITELVPGASENAPF